MDFTGRYEISSPPERVWNALNDAAVLQSCIAGCERLTRRDDHHFDAVLVLRVGPVKATLQAMIEQSELEPPRRCVLKGEARGGAVGFGRGEAEVMLAPCDAGTTLTYIARATIGGKLARTGQRLIDSAARKIADDFFACFAAQIATWPAAAAATAEPVEPELEPEEGVENVRRAGLAPEIWVIGLIAVIVILLVLFGVAL
jgi:uncharacterized protein